MHSKKFRTLALILVTTILMSFASCSGDKKDRKRNRDKDDEVAESVISDDDIAEIEDDYTDPETIDAVQIMTDYPDIGIYFRVDTLEDGTYDVVDNGDTLTVTGQVITFDFILASTGFTEMEVGDHVTGILGKRYTITDIYEYDHEGENITSISLTDSQGEMYVVTLSSDNRDAEKYIVSNDRIYEHVSLEVATNSALVAPYDEYIADWLSGHQAIAIGEDGLVYGRNQTLNPVIEDILNQCRDIIGQFEQYRTVASEFWDYYGINITDSEDPLDQEAVTKINRFAPVYDVDMDRLMTVESAQEYLSMLQDKLEEMEWCLNFINEYTAAHTIPIIPDDATADGFLSDTDVYLNTWGYSFVSNTPTTYGYYDFTGDGTLDLIASFYSREPRTDVVDMPKYTHLFISLDGGEFRLVGAFECYGESIQILSGSYVSERGYDMSLGYSYSLSGGGNMGLVEANSSGASIIGEYSWDLADGRPDFTGEPLVG